MARQSNRELREIADPAVDLDTAAVLLGDDVVADRKPEAGPLAGRLGRKEGLEQLVFDLGWNAGAIVSDAEFNCVAGISRRYLQCRVELRVASLLLAFGGGIEAITEQVETNAGDLLGDKFDRGDRGSVIALQRDVEALILGAGTMKARFSASSTSAFKSTLRRSPLLPRECSSMLLTILSARLPCWAIFSRLPVSITIVSSISVRLSWPSVAIAGAAVSFNSSSNSTDSPAKLLTKLSGFLISWAIPASTGPMRPSSRLG
jgi:hypothetical protein